MSFYKMSLFCSQNLKLCLILHDISIFKQYMQNISIDTPIANYDGALGFNYGMLLCFHIFIPNIIHRTFCSKWYKT